MKSVRRNAAVFNLLTAFSLVCVFVFPAYSQDIANREYIWRYDTKYHARGPTHPLRAVLTSQDELSTMWAVLFTDAGGSPEKPVVDFSRYWLVVVSMGIRNTSGFAIVANAFGADGKIQVVERSPGIDCITAQSITYPFDIILVPIRSKLPSFDEVNSVQVCRN